MSGPNPLVLTEVAHQSDCMFSGLHGAEFLDCKIYYDTSDKSEVVACVHVSRCSSSMFAFMLLCSGAFAA